MSNMIMMNNLAFDEAQLTLVKGLEIPTLPLSNLQFYGNSDVFRTQTLDEIEIKITFEQRKFVTGLVLWRHNLSITSTVRWRGYTDDAMTNLAFDTGEIRGIEIKALGEFVWLVDPIGMSIFGKNKSKFTEMWLPNISSKAVKHQIITIKDTDNQDLYIDIARIFNGFAFTPKTNFNYGAKAQKIAVVDEGFLTDDGSFPTIDSPLIRHSDFQLDWLEEDERPLFDDFQEAVGLHHDFYVSLYPSATAQKRANHSFACKFKTLPPITHTHFNNYAAPIALREV